MSRRVDAVIFDVGGVLARNGRPGDFAKRFPDHDPAAITAILMGDYGSDGDHPWHRLERGEITLEENRRLNREAFAAAGIQAPSFASDRASFRFEPNVPVIELVHALRAAGLKLGVLTNNIAEFRPLWWPLLPFAEVFDDVVDSHEVGVRKPNPAIFRLALARLDVTAERTAFLDDVQSNVDGAASVGIHGVLVDDDPTGAVTAVRELAGLRVEPTAP